MGTNGLPFWKASQLDNLLKVALPNGNVIYVAPVDQISSPPGVQWGGNETDIAALMSMPNLAAANMDFSGSTNTAAIVAQLGDNGGTAYAAKVCADLVAYGFDDWYLPAAGELNEMYKRLGPVSNGESGQITTGAYWSSSEYYNYVAWRQYFDNGYQISVEKNGFNQCRCVRK